VSTTTTFRPLAAEVGCLEYLIYAEIRHCLGLRRGGVNHEGEHWVYKSAQELADLFGVARNTAAKALKRLAERGLVARQKLGVAVGHITNRAWYYCLGEAAPEFVRSRLRNATPSSGAMHCAPLAQSNSNTTLINNHSKPERPPSQQPTAGTREAISKARALAENGASAPVERDKDGFLVSLGPKAAEAAQEHPELSEEELTEEICKQIEEQAVQQEEKARRLNPLHGVLGDLQKRAKGFA